MPRIVRVLVAAGLLASLLVGLPAQPASALGRCNDIGITHYHWHSAHLRYHEWTVIQEHVRSDGRHVYTSYEYEHKRWDTAIC